MTCFLQGVALVTSLWVAHGWFVGYLEQHPAECPQLEVGTHRTELVQTDDGTPIGTRVYYRCKRRP